jgi:acetyl esterase/lipase
MAYLGLRLAPTSRRTRGLVDAPRRHDGWHGTGDLPPAFIDVGSAETFRDEDVSYASRIWQAGGSAELHVWPGGFHGFAMIAPDAAPSREATQRS